MLGRSGPRDLDLRCGDAVSFLAMTGRGLPWPRMVMVISWRSTQARMRAALTWTGVSAEVPERYASSLRSRAWVRDDWRLMARRGPGGALLRIGGELTADMAQAR